MPSRDIIVVGASAGGVQALTELVRGLPADLPAAVFIVVHVSPTSPGILPEILERAGPMHAAHARDGESIRPGRIYVAPPDHHMVLRDDRVDLTHGPRENGFRPSVDPLFRTAARSHGPRVVGVVLSGGLDDGTEGLAMIKQYGGLAVVQDPSEAAVPSMPASAIAHVEVDHVLPVAQISALISRVAHEPLPEGVLAMHPPEHNDRPDVSEVGDVNLVTHDLPDPPTGLTCPECGGALWELRSGKLIRFRCHVGHGYSAEGLVAEQTRALESALWAALRSLEESADLRRRLSRRARAGNWVALAGQYDQQADEAEARATVIRQVLLSEKVEDAELNPEAKPPRPSADGPLYGKRGRTGDPTKKAPAKSKTRPDNGGTGSKGMAAQAKSAAGAKASNGRKTTARRQGANGRKK